MTRTKLFEDIVKDTDDPEAYTGRCYDFLAGCPRADMTRIREELERWYLRYPEPREDLRARFRSSKERQHLGAFFELYTHEIFRQQGFVIETHAEGGGDSPRRPDFLLERDGVKVFVECEVMKDPITNDSVEANRGKVFDAFNRKSSPNFRVCMDILEASKQQPPAGKWCKALLKKLEKLDPDEVQRLIDEGRHDDLPSWTLEGNDWRVRFEPVPKPLSDRGAQSMGLLHTTCHGSGVFDVELEKLNDAYSNKRPQVYDIQDWPYVIALNCMSPSFREDEVEASLIGELFAPRRKSNGFWHRGGEPTNQRVSAILFVNDLVWSIVTERAPTLWVNPWAQNPVPDDLWAGRRMTIDPNALRRLEHPGKTAHELLNLPSSWPDGDD
jgi:hypothetical protein